jgi:isocitrate/isopropylmalate dehydrogenase
MARKRVAVIPGEDASPEAVHPTIDILRALALDLDFVFPAIGAEGLRVCGDLFPAAARETIDQSDAVLFGAASTAAVPALFYLRWGKQTYANLRPARWIPGFNSPLADPAGIDIALVRENLEDVYAGIEGDLAQLAALDLQSLTWRCPLEALAPGKFALKVITERGTERILRFAFALAQRRKRAGRPGRLTCTQKHNMLFISDGLFRQTAQRLAPEFIDVELEVLIIDDFAHRLVRRPQDFDVVVMPNQYGDILSDAAAGLIGGLGLAPSGCYGDSFAYFEPCHGTAPDLAGKGCINPTATILSAVMMLEHLGHADAARSLDAAVAAVYADGRWLTPDQGGRASTIEFCTAVTDMIRT